MPTELWPCFSTRLRPADPQDPGENPSYDQSENQTHNTTIRDVWQLEKKNYEEFKHMNRALADRLLSLLPEEYKHSFIAQQLTQNPKMTFLEVFR